MNNQTIQMIADSQAVVHCLNASTTKALGSHPTFTIDELLEKINITSNSIIPLEPGFECRQLWLSGFAKGNK
jgi:hypothetical protein